MPVFWQLEDIPDGSPALLVPGLPPVSYGELAARADAWAADLHRLCPDRRPLVALEFPLTVEAIAAYLGALRAGYPVLIAEPGTLTPASAIMRTWRPDVLVAAGGDALTAQRLPGDPDRPEPHPDLRVLLSTSGSTGEPKLVRLSARNIASNAEAIAEYLAITAADRAMSTLPLFYSYGLSVLNSYLAAGASLVLTESSVVEAGFWHLLRDLRATSMALVPHQFDLLDRTGFADMELPSLRYVTQAGGKLAPEAVQRFAALARAGGWQLVVMYGQTEAAPRIAYVPPGDLDTAYDTIGKAIPGGRLWLKGDDGREIDSPGVAGELVYRGPNVMMGYAAIPADLATGHELEELSTGDIAERTEAGLFRVVGRLKRFVKLYGLRISLDQVEQLLRGRGVEAYAVAHGDELVILHRTGESEAVRQAVAAEYELPEMAITAGAIDEVPVLASGKPDQAALRELAAHLVATEREMPEGKLRELIARVTRSADVSEDDTFASLGGDSLGYLHVQMALEARLGRAPEQWEDMPIGRLEAMAPAASPDAGTRPVDIDVLLRVFAISLVVAVHSGAHMLFGGPWMLISLMGFGMARYQSGLLAEGRIGTFVAKTLYPIVPLYFGLLILMHVAYAPAPLPYFFLLGNYHEMLPGRGHPVAVLWFVGLYVQMILILAALAAVPHVRELLARDKWLFGAILMVLTMSVEVAVMSSPLLVGKLVAWPAPHAASHGLAVCLPLFFLGWMIRSAETPARRLLSALAAIAGVIVFARAGVMPSATFFLGATLALLLIGPKIELPALLSVSLQRAATVTLFVYLLHSVVISALSKVVPDPVLLAPAAIAASFAVAFATKAAFDWFDGHLTAYLGRGYRIALRREAR